MIKREGKFFCDLLERILRQRGYVLRTTIPGGGVVVDKAGNHVGSFEASDDDDYLAIWLR